MKKTVNRTIVHETPEKSRVEGHHFINETLHEAIEKKAYELYEGRGCAHGHHLDDWLKAEMIMRGRQV